LFGQDQNLREQRARRRAHRPRRRLDSAVLERARSLGLFGLAIPVEFGGSGLSVGAYARVLQEIAASDASLALVLHTHQALVAGAAHVRRRSPEGRFSCRGSRRAS
jgi:alkylation response protein AidB-like acyl-CoA dehydrogenase